MADSTIAGLPANAGLALADLVEVVDDPAGTPASQKATIQQVHDAINLLVASGALTATDIAGVFNGGAAKGTTVQKIMNAIALLSAATLPLAGDEVLPVVQSGTAVQATVDELVQYSNDSVPNDDTWVVKGATADGDTTPTAIGDSCTPVSGTTSVTAADSTQPTGVNQLTGNVSGNQAYYSGGAQFLCIKRLSFAAMVSLRETTSVRCFVNLATSNFGTYGGSDTVGGGVGWVGFRFSTNVPDTNWVYTYGTGGAGSFVDTGVAVDTAAPQLLEVRLRQSGNADFYINRVKVGNNVAITTPTGTALLLSAGVTTLTNAGRNLRYYQHKVAQRFF